MAKNSVIYLAIVTGDTAARTIADRHVGPYHNPTLSIEQVRDLLARAIGGTEDAKVHLFQDKCDGTAATGTIACTQANAVAGDTFTLAGVVFTVATSPSTEASLGEFAAGASDTAMGDNLAAAINAHPALNGLLTAAAVTGTVTWTARDKGLFGNLIRMAETGTSMVVTQATNGAIGTVQSPMRTFRRGIQ